MVHSNHVMLIQTYFLISIILKWNVIEMNLIFFLHSSIAFIFVYVIACLRIPAWTL